MKNEAILGPAASDPDPRSLQELGDQPEVSGSRWALWERLKARVSSEHPAVSIPSAPVSTAELDHGHARELLVTQQSILLPPAEANALAAHLLTCDGCYRFAQNLAAEQH